MEINKDFKLAHQPLADTKVLIIDNFLKNPLDLTSRKFEHKEQLMPYPIGRREKENINEPILYEIIEQNYNTTVSSTQAEYVYTDFHDLGDYKSTAFEEVMIKNWGKYASAPAPHEVPYETYDETGQVLKSRELAVTDNPGNLINNDENFTDEKEFIDFLIKEKGFQNHPARPRWDVKQRYHAILFLINYDQMQKEKFNGHVAHENVYPFYFWRSRFIEDFVQGAKWDDSILEDKKKYYSFLYYLDFRYHQWFSSKWKDFPGKSARISHDNFHIEHALCDYIPINEIENINNRLIIFPGWYFHSTKYHMEWQYPQLSLNMIFE